MQNVLTSWISILIALSALKDIHKQLFSINKRELRWRGEGAEKSKFSLKLGKTEKSPRQWNSNFSKKDLEFEFILF